MKIKKIMVEFKIIYLFYFWKQLNLASVFKILVKDTCYMNSSWFGVGEVTCSTSSEGVCLLVCTRVRLLCRLMCRKLQKKILIFSGVFGKNLFLICFFFVGRRSPKCYKMYSKLAEVISVVWEVMHEFCLWDPSVLDFWSIVACCVELSGFRNCFQWDASVIVAFLVLLFCCCGDEKSARFVAIIGKLESCGNWKMSFSRPGTSWNFENSNQLFGLWVIFANP